MTPTLIAQLQFDLQSLGLPWSADWLPQTLGTMLVCMTCGVLGCFVVLRRMALIGDALSHSILPGVVVALILFGLSQSPTDWLPQSVRDALIASSQVRWMPLWLLGGAMIAGLLTTMMIALVNRRSRTKEDSAIGIAFTAMFAVGLILISDLPRGTHFDLRCFIYGDPLAFQRSDLVLMSIICPLVLLIVTLMYHRLKIVSFDPVVAAAMGLRVGLVHYLLMGMLAATIVAGIKATGVILVVAMIITPASAAYQLTNRLWAMLALAAMIGAACAGVGMSIAFAVNAPTGPVMVLVAVILFMLSVLFSPSHGWVFDRLRRVKLARHVANEDVLKAIYRMNAESLIPNHVEAIGAETGLKRSVIGKAVSRLVAENLVRLNIKSTGEPILTESGAKHAEQLVRAHRLWETYLVSEAGIPVESVHGPAERLEHAHELSDALSDALGRPEQDPHGSKIPGQD